MKLSFKRYIPHTLVFMLIASSPLSVLSTTAYANTLEQATQQQESLATDSIQEALPNPVTEEGGISESVTESDDKQETTPPPLTEIEDENSTEPPLVEEATEPSTPPPTENVEEEPIETPTEEETELPVETPTFQSRYDEAKKAMTDAKTYVDKRELVDKAMDTFKKEQTLENLQLLTDYIVLLPYYSEDIYKGDKAYFANNLYNLYEFLKDGKEKDELLHHFATKSITQTWETMNRNDLEISIMAHRMLPEGSKKEANKVELDKVTKAVYKHNSDPDSGYVDWDDPNLEFPDAPSGNDGNWEPGYNPGDSDEEEYPMPDPFEEGYSIINYSYENGTCYKTTTEYKPDGSLRKTTKKVATKDEQVFCNINIPDGNAKDYYGDNWEKEYIGNLNGSPDGSVTPDELVDAEATLKTDTIQYTFEKDSDSPYYYDTGIHVSKDNTLTYQQARDALYQVAVQSKGKFVEDKDRALALLDGLIILVEDTGKPIPVQDFIALFEETSIGVKAQGPKSQDSNALVDLVEIKTVSTVVINGKEFELETSPIVDDGSVLFPVEQIAKSLDGVVSSTDDSTTVEFKGNRITFTDNQSSAKENGKDKSLSAHTRKNQDGIRMVEVQSLLDFFQSKVEVHSSSNEVVITKK